MTVDCLGLNFDLRSYIDSFGKFRSVRTSVSHYAVRFVGTKFVHFVHVFEVGNYVRSYLSISVEISVSAGMPRC